MYKNTIYIHSKAYEIVWKTADLQIVKQAIHRKGMTQKVDVKIADFSHSAINSHSISIKKS